MPTQMPRTGRRAGQPLGDDLVAADRPQPGHAGRERADARHDQPVGAQRRVGVGADLGVGAGPLQRALGGAQVARTVVEHHNARPTAGHGGSRHNDRLAWVPAARLPGYRAAPADWTARLGSPAAQAIPRFTPGPPGSGGGLRKGSNVMYIGIGTIVLIVIIVLLVLFLRRA